METAGVFSAKHHQTSFPVTLSNGHTAETNQHPRDEGFEFMSNVVWAEIGRAIMEELGSIVFAAGRPDDFRQASVQLVQFMLRTLTCCVH